MGPRLWIILGVLVLGVCTGLNFTIDTTWFDMDFEGKNTREAIGQIIDSLLDALPEF